MTGEYLAHSAKDDHSAQTYRAHVSAVKTKSVQYAEAVMPYCPKGGEQLIHIAARSALLHDIGKLDDENQAVLQSSDKAHRHLPINHVDAGTAVLLAEDNLYSALMVYSHHHGLPDLSSEEVRGDSFLRDESHDVREHVNASLPMLLKRHGEIFPACEKTPDNFYEGNQSVFFRMGLSCLADADHGDTAAAYGQAPEEESMPPLRAEERLAALDSYVAKLPRSDERGCLRGEMYSTCRDAKSGGGFAICDSPVGSGKTTAVMAHLLKQAAERGLRRIFVVLPYTSIIRQSVKVYREALVLPGEDENQVVAELHCRADFQDKDTRYLTSLWRAPIVVTTAVAFFETLASCRPAALRRLHELPGSAIFVDEAHNALPLKLLPLAWKWMNTLADEWSCYWVLSSGSLVRYWQLSALSDVNMTDPHPTDIVSRGLRERLMRYEENRISYEWQPEPIGCEELAEWVQSAPGPRLLIVNTVKSAAVIADIFCKKFGRERIEHLSTALTAEDRGYTIDRVRARLDDKSDNDWTLVATSCVEAGVDFSFRTGFRELSSLLSLLQAAGRVNRGGDCPDSRMWSFTLADDTRLTVNPSLDTSRRVLRDYLSRGAAISPELSTDSMNRELLLDDSCLRDIEEFLREEESMQFPEVDKNFQVIGENTVPAVIDDTLAAQILHGKGNWQEFQKKAVSIRRGMIQKWRLKELADGVYQWTLGYDSFLGYMQGVLNEEHLSHDFLCS